MTPETARALEQADEHIARGHAMLGIGLNEDAGRAAYLAAFHAAQALIFECTGNVVKTHRGVQSEFLRLAKSDPNFTPEQQIFLARAYNFKAVADYNTGNDRALSQEQARAGLTAAQSFTDAARRALTPSHYS